MKSHIASSLAVRGLLLLLLALLVLLVAACGPLPTAAPSAAPAAEDALDDTWGPYLAEREWGNPREATRRGDGWSFTYEKALSTPYRFGADGIGGLTDRDLHAAFALAFFRPGEPYVTERLYGLDGPSGRYGETILEDRTFYENTPTHSYTRYRYRYPFSASLVEAEIEQAKYDRQTFVVRVTLTGLATGTLHLLPQVWLPPVGGGGEVVRDDERTWDAAYTSGHLLVVADREPAHWQATANRYPDRAAINAALVNGGHLTDSGAGDKAAWEFIVPLHPGDVQTFTFGLAVAEEVAAGQSQAAVALSVADDLLASRRAAARSLYADDVTAHQAVYQAALMSLLWNKMFYAYDGSYQPEWKGSVNVRDVILVPDRWEFPWPAMWDTCFQAKVATLADIELARHDLRLFLSDRWQTETGHVPNVEWALEGETPPLFAWAVWQVYEADHDRDFLAELFPRLERHYAFVRRAYDRDHDALHTGGFMGMDNIPRPGPPDEEEADLSGWVALFARDMARIADELGQTERGDFYRAEYAAIVAQINAQLWDEETGFYYDRNGNGLLREKSYAGLIPFIAGASDASRTARILAHLSDPAEFWSEYGIRSLSADSSIYEPGYSESGWKNSNWRGPIWMPVNYLLVQRLEESDPALADRLRENLIANVERQWETTGRFWEYYHAETGAGLGADHQTGWTALVANLIYEKYAAGR